MQKHFRKRCGALAAALLLCLSHMQIGFASMSSQLSAGGALSSNIQWDVAADGAALQLNGGARLTPPEETLAFEEEPSPTPEESPTEAPAEGEESGVLSFEGEAAAKALAAPLSPVPEEAERPETSPLSVADCALLEGLGAQFVEVYLPTGDAWAEYRLTVTNRGPTDCLFAGARYTDLGGNYQCSLSAPEAGALLAAGQSCELVLTVRLQPGREGAPPHRARPSAALGRMHPPHPRKRPRCPIRRHRGYPVRQFCPAIFNKER